MTQALSQTFSTRLPEKGDGLQRYFDEIRKFPMLEPTEEFQLAKRWRESGDREAAHRLVTSHLRLVAKIAMGYRGYGLPASDVISEGNVGLMQAVKRFDPSRGFRLATYAMWWIKASIQDYILKSWSLVKVGTTANQKKLFFNLRKLKGKIAALEEGDLTPEHALRIADQLGVHQHEVVEMNRRLSGDLSLNTPVGEGQTTWQDWLSDASQNQEEELGNQQEFDQRLSLVRSALERLNERERDIFVARHLTEPVVSLEKLSQIHSVSRERIRQIDARAFEKIRAFVARPEVAS